MILEILTFAFFRELSYFDRDPQIKSANSYFGNILHIISLKKEKKNTTIGPTLQTSRFIKLLLLKIFIFILKRDDLILISTVTRWYKYFEFWQMYILQNIAHAIFMPKSQKFWVKMNVVFGVIARIPPIPILYSLYICSLRG